MKRLLEQSDLLIVDKDKVIEIIERERSALQTEHEKNQFNHLLKAFGDPSTKDNLRLVSMMFVMDEKYSRTAIIHALRAVELSRGWH